MSQFAASTPLSEYAEGALVNINRGGLCLADAYDLRDFICTLNAELGDERWALIAGPHGGEAICDVLLRLPCIRGGNRWAQLSVWRNEKPGDAGGSLRFSMRDDARTTQHETRLRNHPWQTSEFLAALLHRAAPLLQMPGIPVSSAFCHATPLVAEGQRLTEAWPWLAKSMVIRQHHRTGNPYLCAEVGGEAVLCLWGDEAQGFRARCRVAGEPLTTCFSGVAAKAAAMALTTLVAEVA